MRNTTRLLGLIALALLIGLPGILTATQRAGLLQLSWGRTIPKDDERSESQKPLLVYISTGEESRDQDRFDEVVMANESFLLAAKFFTCVRGWDEDAREHPLLLKIKYTAPAMVAFDSTRKVHAVAGGRASAMKVYGMLCKVGQPDYETSIAKTVRAARNLLGSFDRIDAAQDALGIKLDRLNEARGDGNAAKTRQLQKEVKKDQAAIDALSEKTRTRWSEIWDLKQKKREAAEEEGAD
jgi:hypothetical protein